MNVERLRELRLLNEGGADRAHLGQDPGKCRRSFPHGSTRKAGSGQRGARSITC